MPGRRIEEGFGGPGLTLWSLGKTNSALHPSNGCASDGSQGHGSDQGWPGVSALSKRDGMIGVTETLGDDPALFVYGETAGVVAIARASGFDNVLLQHRRLGQSELTIGYHNRAIYFVSQMDKFPSRPV